MMTLEQLRELVEAKLEELDKQVMQADTDIKNLAGMAAGLRMVQVTLNQELNSDEDNRVEQGAEASGAGAGDAECQDTSGSGCDDCDCGNS